MMIETLHLLPPDLGPRSNPVLFGIAEALAQLLPVITPRAGEEAGSGPQPCAMEESVQPAPASAL